MRAYDKIKIQGAQKEGDIVIFAHSGQLIYL